MAPGNLQVQFSDEDGVSEVNLATIFFYGLGKWKKYDVFLSDLKVTGPGVGHYDFQVDQQHDFLRDMGMALRG